VWNENYGCAWPSVDLLIAVNSSFSEKAPDVAEMFSKWVFDTPTLGSALAYQDLTGGEPVDVAIWYLKNSEDLWTQFVPADIAEKVKEAVAGM
jgi:glycine betaine/proline transport system substrate-binding protein